MEVPIFVRDQEAEFSEQQDYQEQLNQTLLQNLGYLGFNITPITTDDLTVASILDPNSGDFTTVMDLALVGATWFVLDATPPVTVQKVAANPTILKQFTATNWP